MNHVHGAIEYSFAAFNVGSGFIIFEPFDICGNTPILFAPSTCSSFGAIMGMTGATPHVKVLNLRWRYWGSVESYKNGDKGIQCKQTVTLEPPCRNSEIYDIYICFNKTEVFIVYNIVWAGWNYKENILHNGCPVDYFEDLVGELSFFKKIPMRLCPLSFPPCKKNTITYQSVG